MTSFEPAYLSLWRSGELARRAERALEHLHACVLCARMCGVDRTVRLGGCRTGRYARVASYGAHHGEEDPLRGWGGSGTIFFSWCNLRCIYCQNHDISQRPAGREVDAETLSAMMLSLQAEGCHNINLVSPSHVVAQILEALAIAVPAGLRLPLVYNTGGYDSPASLALLDGIVDTYMPDMKYSDRLIARGLSKIGNYPVMNRAAVKEMYRQVGDLQIDDQGIATRGLLVRHLVLPGGLSGTAEVVRFLAEEISPNTYLNLMDQYRPAFKARLHPVLRRGLTAQEFEAALAMAHQAGLHRLDHRGTYDPRFGL
jgi:putative pyruvate formate lyase activating enzyme